MRRTRNWNVRTHCFVEPAKPVAGSACQFCSNSAAVMTKQEKVFLYISTALAVFATTLGPPEAPADAWPQMVREQKTGAETEKLASTAGAVQNTPAQAEVQTAPKGTTASLAISGYTPRHSACAEILSAARDVGWPAWALSHLEPLMWRESRCQNGARNENANGTIDRGALQINSAHIKMLRAKKVLTDLDELHDPHVNMRAALALYRFFGNSFCPWDPDGYCS